MLVHSQPAPPLTLCSALWCHGDVKTSAMTVAPWEGHIVGGNLNNYQHASVYPAFIISGIVDVLASRAKAPPGTDKLYLSLAFLYSAMLMGLHKKHAPLDRAVHTNLFYAMLATAVCTLGEVALPHSLMLSLGRVGTVALQGAWLLAAARMLFESASEGTFRLGVGHLVWDEREG
mmetsp:Transcript_15651/g.46174  ORF Transcript_15651/g.46174 Transcript_15651/m.46174 type:complete len:175 (+) Transcript_15651:129-653(+)